MANVFKFHFMLWDEETEMEREIVKEIPLKCTDDEFMEWLQSDRIADILSDLEIQYGLHDFFGGENKYGWEVGFCSDEVSEDNIEPLMAKWYALLKQGGRVD